MHCDQGNKLAVHQSDIQLNGTVLCQEVSDGEAYLGDFRLTWQIDPSLEAQCLDGRIFFAEGLEPDM